MTTQDGTLRARRASHGPRPGCTPSSRAHSRDPAVSRYCSKHRDPDSESPDRNLAPSLYGPANASSRHSYASGIFAAKSAEAWTCRLTGSHRGPGHPPSQNARTNERTLTPLLRLWDLRYRIALHDQHARARPAASPVYATGRACFVPTLGPTNALSRHSYASGIFAATSRNYDQYASQSLARARTRRSAGSHHGPGLHLLRPLEHGPRPPSTPAPLPRIKDLASRLRSWSRWDYHPPAHAMGRGPDTPPRHEKVPSPASESDSDVLDPSYLPVAGQTRARSTSSLRR
jgi:hypothetical protein